MNRNPSPFQFNPDTASKKPLPQFAPHNSQYPMPEIETYLKRLVTAKGGQSRPAYTFPSIDFLLNLFQCDEDMLIAALEHLMLDGYDIHFDLRQQTVELVNPAKSRNKALPAWLQWLTDSQPVWDS